MPSAHTAAAAAALRQQFGPGVAPMPTSKMMPRTGGPVAKGGAKGGKGYLTDGGSSGPQLTTDQQKVENLKRQVALLEADNRLLQQTHGGGATDGASVGVDPTIRQLRSDYARTESSFQARENELAAKVEELRKETLGAKLRERRAVDEMAEAKQLLSEQREKFAATRQELTSEVIAYQRDLDELLTSKRQLEVDLADAQQALQQREQFVSGYDEKMRLVESIKMQKEEECERLVAEAAALRVELNEERVRGAKDREKYEGLRSHQSQVEQMRASYAAEAERATAELRTAKIALEAEQHARQKADDDKAYLVREGVTLSTTIQELTTTAEFISAENARLKREAAGSKVQKVVTAFMVRKMRDKLNEAKAAEQRARVSSDALHSKVVQAEQRAAAIERELMLHRRRASEREEAYDQQRADASELSVENRMLLDKTEQMIADSQRYVARLEQSEALTVELQSELEMMRERAETEKALRALRPEDLAAVSRVNSALSESIQTLLPRLSKEGQPRTSASAPAI